MRERLIEKYYEILRDFVIELEFRKQNGEIRYARCTRNTELIPDPNSVYYLQVNQREDIQNKFAPSKKSDKIIVFDIVKNHWIVFSVDNVLDLIDIKPIDHR